MRRLWPLGLAALALTACGPSVPLNAAMRGAPVNVALGAQPTPPPTAARFPNIIPNFPAPIGIPPFPFNVTLPPPVLSLCPTPGPDTFPALSALPAPAQRPSNATYPFRYAGTETFPGSNAPARSLAGSGTQQVENVSTVQADGSYTFDVVETDGGRTVTTTYKVIASSPNGGAFPPPTPGPVAPPTTPPTTPPTLPPTNPPPTLAPQNTSATAGLYLQSMTGQLTAGDSSTDTFAPVPPVLLMPFPAQPRLTYQGGGTDGTTGQSMQEDPQGGVIQQQARVPVCGAVVDSWETQITGTIGEARLSGTNAPDPTRTTFTLTLNVATQYGGIIVGSHLVEKGVDQQSGRTYTYDRTADIDAVPQAPQSS